jgi:hypothetical protein
VCTQANLHAVWPLAKCPCSTKRPRSYRLESTRWATARGCAHRDDVSPVPASDGSPERTLSGIDAEVTSVGARRGLGCSCCLPPSLSRLALRYTLSDPASSTRRHVARVWLGLAQLGDRVSTALHRSEREIAMFKHPKTTPSRRPPVVVVRVDLQRIRWIEPCPRSDSWWPAAAAVTARLPSTADVVSASTATASAAKRSPTRKAWGCRASGPGAAHSRAASTPATRWCRERCSPPLAPCWTRHRYR